MKRSTGLWPAVLTWITVSSLSAAEICCDADGCCSSCLHRGGTPATLFCWSETFAAQSDVARGGGLITDRPYFTQSSSTVGLGRAQLEWGYTFLSDEAGGRRVQLHSWGEPLLRMGVLRDWLELRVGGAPLTVTREIARREETTSGWDDLYLGLKLGLTPQAGLRPRMALIPQMSIPVGSASFSADEVLPGINWTYSWDVSDCLWIAGSTQFNRRRSVADEAYTRWAQSMNVGYAPTPRWGVYGEWFAFFPHSAVDVKPEHALNAGFTYLINRNLQWDLRAGLGMNDAAPDFFCGTGLSWRFR